MFRLFYSLKIHDLWKEDRGCLLMLIKRLFTASEWNEKRRGEIKGCNTSRKTKLNPYFSKRKDQNAPLSSNLLQIWGKFSTCHDPIYSVHCPHSASLQRLHIPVVYKIQKQLILWVCKPRWWWSFISGFYVCFLHNCVYFPLYWSEYHH